MTTLADKLLAEAAQIAIRWLATMTMRAPSRRLSSMRRLMPTMKSSGRWMMGEARRPRARARCRRYGRSTTMKNAALSALRAFLFRTMTAPMIAEPHGAAQKKARRRFCYARPQARGRQ